MLPDIAGRRQNGTAPREGQLHIHLPFDLEIPPLESRPTNAVANKCNMCAQIIHHRATHDGKRLEIIQRSSAGD